MARRTQIFTFLSIFTFFVISVYSQECVQKSPCSCVFEDGRKIDLKQLEGKPFLTSVTSSYGNNLTYYFHACSDKKLTLPVPNKLLNECTETSLCLFNQTTDVNKTSAINLGNAKDLKFRFITNSEKYLLFDHNKHNISTLIYLACTDYSETILDFKQIDSNNVHNLILFSEANCAFYEKAGLSTGSVLVILLFTFSAAYLLGGMAVLHFLRGARGKEMIPNVDFWNDLPNLVTEGAVFLQNGCKPVISNADTYDRI